MLINGPVSTWAFASYSSVGLIVTDGKRRSEGALNVNACSNLTPCFAIIWSSAASNGPRFVLVMAPVTVRSTGPVSVMLAAMEEAAGNRPATAVLVRNLRLFMCYVPRNVGLRFSKNACTPSL